MIRVWIGSKFGEPVNFRVTSKPALRGDIIAVKGCIKNFAIANDFGNYGVSMKIDEELAQAFPEMWKITVKCSDIPKAFTWVIREIVREGCRGIESCRDASSEHTVEDFGHIVCVMPRHAGRTMAQEMIDFIKEESTKRVQDILDDSVLKGTSPEKIAVGMAALVESGFPSKEDWDRWAAELPNDFLAKYTKEEDENKAKVILAPNSVRTLTLKMDSSCRGWCNNPEVLKRTVRHLFISAMDCIKTHGYVKLHDLDPYFRTCRTMHLSDVFENAKISRFSWNFMSPAVVRDARTGKYVIRIKFTAHIAGEDHETLLDRVAEDQMQLDNRMDAFEGRTEYGIKDIKDTLNKHQASIKTLHGKAESACNRSKLNEANLNALTNAHNQFVEEAEKITNKHLKEIHRLDEVTVGHQQMIDSILKEQKLQGTEKQHIIDELDALDTRVGAIVKAVNGDKDILKKTLELQQDCFNKIEELRAHVAGLNFINEVHSDIADVTLVRSGEPFAGWEGPHCE